MKKIAFIILLSFQFSNSQNFNNESEEGIELEKNIDNKDTLKIIALHKKNDVDFNSEWKLNKIEKKVEIDHFKYGYIFKWTKQKLKKLEHYLFIPIKFHHLMNKKEKLEN